MQNSLFRSLCVPFDGSPAAGAALEIALSILDTGGRLTLVNALNRSAIIAATSTPYGADSSSALDAFEDSQRTVLEDARARCARSGTSATAVSLDGYPASAIAAFVDSGHFDAIVMGTHARHGLARFFLGSTAEAVLRVARVPVIVTSELEHSRIASGIHSVLLAFDETEPAQSAAQFSAAVARGWNAHLTIVHVRERDVEDEAVATRALTRAREGAARRGVTSESVMLTGEAPTAIATAAEARAADLIVIGTHGRNGLTRLRFGSVAAAVVRGATMPVMVVPASAHVPAAAYAAHSIGV